MEQLPREREVILVDASRDLRLAEIRQKAESLVTEFPHLETKIRVLAMYVSNTMGGIQIDDIAAPNEIEKLATEVISYVKGELQSNVVHSPSLSLIPRIVITHAHAHTHTHTHTYTHIRTHTHTHINTYTQHNTKHTTHNTTLIHSLTYSFTHCTGSLGLHNPWGVSP